MHDMIEAELLSLIGLRRTSKHWEGRFPVNLTSLSCEGSAKSSSSAGRRTHSSKGMLAMFKFLVLSPVVNAGPGWCEGLPTVMSL